MAKLRLVALALCCLLFLKPDTVFAHKLNIVSWFQGEVLHIEGKFNDGKEIVSGNVEIFSDDDKLISNGQVDQKGHFTFRIHEIDNLKVVLTTPCGHKDFLKIPKNRIKTMLSSFKRDKDKYESVDINRELLKSGIQYPTLDQIELIVSKQLESKLQPISRAIAYGQVKKHGIYDILGGIGYILGLIGLITYIKCSKTKE